MELLPILGIIAWLVMMAATIDIFRNKGQSTWLGVAVGLLLGPIGLIVGLLMPKDPEGIARREHETEQRRQAGVKRLQEYQAEYEQKKANRIAGIEDPHKHDTLSALSAFILIIAPIMMVIGGTDDTVISMGTFAILGFIGLIATNRS